jgi:hypothetical protein
MADFEKCSADLRRLIGIADTNGVPMAERSIDEYVAATEPSDRTGAVMLSSGRSADFRCPPRGIGPDRSGSSLA